MKKYLLWILIASMPLFILGCRSVDTRPSVSQARDDLDKKEGWRYQLPISDTTPVLPVFPNVQKATLTNGLKIFLVEDHRLPIAEVALVFKSGSARDPYGYSGLSHLTASMLKEGTRHKTSLELAEAFANLGTEVSVSVGKDMSEISSAVLSNKIDDVIVLMSSMVKEPRMDKDDFARLKLQHQSLLSSQQAVLGYVAQTSFLMAAYGEKHPYA